jgi:hypothetical protein
MRRREVGRLTARTLAWRGAARAEEDGVRRRRSGCWLWTGAGAGSRRAGGIGTAAQATGSQPRAAKRLLWAADGCGERMTGGAARGLGVERPEM